MFLFLQILGVFTLLDILGPFGDYQLDLTTAWHIGLVCFPNWTIEKMKNNGVYSVVKYNPWYRLYDPNIKVPYILSRDRSVAARRCACLDIHFISLFGKGPKNCPCFNESSSTSLQFLNLQFDAKSLQLAQIYSTRHYNSPTTFAKFCLLWMSKSWALNTHAQTLIFNFTSFRFVVAEINTCSWTTW